MADVPTSLPDERFETLIETGGVRIERIVSTGQVTAGPDWYDQVSDEWVLVVAGEADLLIEGEPAPRRLAPGDWLFLPAHVRHRVTRTSTPTVWLTLHLDAAP